MRFMISGASGTVGRGLVPFLQSQGHSVTRLVRRPACGPEEVFWNPATGELAPEAMRGMDAVVNLAGESIAGGRWSAARRESILRSRVDATRTLVNAMGACARSRPFVFISGSATGFYGDRGDAWLDEEAPPGTGFLAGVCAAWEREAREAEALGVRVVRLRTGMVLAASGGALARMLPFFRAGIGGRLGWRRRWLSWISAGDLAGAIYHAVLDRRCDGAVNAVAPEAVTNAEFARALARVTGRPALLPVPGPVLRMVLGGMAGETVLAGQRVVPGKLQAAEYAFREGKLEDALRHSLR